jgi:hypothetical protein
MRLSTLADGRISTFRRGGADSTRLVTALLLYDMTCIETADVDGDGNPDVLVTDRTSSMVGWFENRTYCPLVADVSSTSLAAGGTQALDLDAGAQKGSELYWVLTNASGATPGPALSPAPLEAPLNPGALLTFTSLYPNQLEPARWACSTVRGRRAPR